MPGGNGRLAALQAAERVGIFNSVVLGQRFWTNDPLDVPMLHAESRRVFKDLLETLKADPSTSPLMVVLGEVGSGKTHLLRALRASAAHDYDAICAYAQFNSPGDRFERHFLGRLVFSCSQKTSGNGTEEDAFARAFVRARALAPDIAAELEQAWEAEDDDPDTTGHLVARLAEALQDQLGHDTDLYNTLRSLIYASAPQAGVRALARQYLSGGPLSRLDASRLPGLPETNATDRTQEQFHSLARALAGLGGGPLIYFLDQAEDLHSMGPEKPRLALECVCRLLDTVPNVAAIISWEHFRYNANFSNLPQFQQDRLKESCIVELRGKRTVPEIRELIGRRVMAAFEAAGVEADANNPLDPLPRDLPEKLVGGATRTVLSKTRDAIRQMALDGPPPESPDDDDNVEHLESAWEAHLSNHPMPNELADKELLELTTWACTQAVAPDGNPAAVYLAQGANGSVECCDLSVPAAGAELRLFALTRNTQGGGLLRQINDAVAARGGRTTVGLRLANFPGNPQTKTVQRMMELFATGGYRVEGSESDIHTISAFRKFVASDVRRAASFDRWKAQAKVLEQLPLVRDVLRLPSSPDGGGAELRDGTLGPDGTAEGAPEIPSAEEASTQMAISGPVSPSTGAGQSISIGVDPHRSTAIAVPMVTLTRHTAVLGGSGSGKTTLIQRMVEQCLLKGVPAVLLDRKGDFAAYADPDIWSAMQGHEGVELQRKVMVSLFTPGKTAGRPLALRLLPQDYVSLDEDDRNEASRSAAEALGQMLGMKDTPTDRERREVLRQAIDEIGRRIDKPLDLPSLIDGLATDHQGLLDRLLRLDPKSTHRRRLIPMLEQLRLSRGYLFSNGDQLDFANLIRPHVPGCARLVVISLAFIPDLGDQQFFVSRLLAEARRFCRASPSKSLQVLLVLDEADVFMPATSKPATKEPLLDLLRRARSSGMGIVIGTQSPGDLDYKGRDNITTWALGRIQDNTALEKIKFVGEGTTLDVRALLPRFSAGRFLLRTEGAVSEVQAHRSLVETTQVPEERILELATVTREGNAS